MKIPLRRIYTKLTTRSIRIKDLTNDEARIRREQAYAARLNRANNNRRSYGKK
jgi:hypothetical protein